MDLFLFIAGVFGLIIGVILLLVNLVGKKPKKTAFMILGLSIVLAITGLMMTPSDDLATDTDEIESSKSKLTEEDLKILKKDFIELDEDEKTRLIIMREDMTAEELKEHKNDLKRLYVKEMTKSYGSKETAEKMFEEGFEYDIRKKNNELTEEEIEKEKIRKEEAEQWIAENLAKLEAEEEQKKKDEKDRKEEVEEVEKEPVQIVEEAAIEEREDVVGKSNKDFTDITNSKPSNVREDATGKWKKVTTSTSEDLLEYLLSYNKFYMTKDTTVHAIVNFTTNTTIMMNDFGSYVSVRVHEYVDKEEHDANMLGSGMLLTEYQIYKDNGDIVKIY